MASAGRPTEVVYLYENVARELDVACAVSAILRDRHGIHAHIVQWPQNVPTLYGRVGTPAAVVLPFCYFEHSFDCLLEWREAAFINLSWEQLFYGGNVKAKTPRGRFATGHVLHHAWSEGYAGFLRDQGVSDAHIFVNGQPAYGLYDEPYRRYFVDRAELATRHGLDTTKRWVFFPENYNWAFYSEEMIQFFLRAGQSPRDVQEMRDFCANSFRQVMQWFVTLARTGEAEVIVRPRPSTPLSQFRAAVEQVVGALPPSMHVLQDETVREWIMASDITLSSHSTSLIEAAVAGRPACMVVPFEVPAALGQDWHRLVPHLRTEAELLDACVGRVVQPDTALTGWARSTFMAHGDAIGNLAAYIAGVATGRVVRAPIPSRHAVTAQGAWPRVPKPVWYVFRRARAYFRHVVPLAPVTTLREFVSADEIGARVERWRGVLRGPSASPTQHAGPAGTVSA